MWGSWGQFLSDSKTSFRNIYKIWFECHTGYVCFFWTLCKKTKQKKKCSKAEFLQKHQLGWGRKHETSHLHFHASNCVEVKALPCRAQSDLLTKFQGDACNRPRRNQVYVAKKNMRSSPLRFWRLSKQNASFDIWNATIPDWVPCWLNVANYWHKGRKEKKNIQDLSWLFGKWKGKMWQKPFFISWWLHWAPKEKLLFSFYFFFGSFEDAGLQSGTCRS